MNEKELLPFCKCGCGLRVTKVGNRFRHGHNAKGDNNPAKLPGVGNKISKSKIGIPREPFSDEWKENMSKSRKKGKIILYMVRKCLK